MIRQALSLYSPRYARTIVYMLQSTEYQPGPYIAWWWRTRDYTTVMKRRTLHRTKAARLLLAGLWLGMLLEIVIGVLLMVLGLTNALTGGIGFGLALIIVTPILWAHLVIVPLLLGNILIVEPRQQRLIAASRSIFKQHPGLRIAVVGSYGKTSMKELLVTVLGEARTVAATPGNKNVAISHAYFAQRLTGKEDVIIIEYGEGAPGDIAAFARNTYPTQAIITGVAPAHLDHYGSLAEIASDIFSVVPFVPDGQAYVNASAQITEGFMPKTTVPFNGRRALGYTITDVVTSLEGTSFMLTKGSKKLRLHSALLGEHQVPVLAFVAAFALDVVGLTPKEVQQGVAKTKPYEHRMQPYQLGGAWIIDDTYNGNIEGIRAGTQLLAELPAKRKIYVTPGLVDQGAETESVHVEMGKLIAAAKPDLVVLMANSVTRYIERGLESAGFKGEIRIEHDPLAFYTGLDQIVAAGDVVLMQNDWTDNYA